MNLKNQFYLYLKTEEVVFTYLVKKKKKVALPLTIHISH